MTQTHPTRVSVVRDLSCHSSCPSHSFSLLPMSLLLLMPFSLLFAPPSSLSPPTHSHPHPLPLTLPPHTHTHLPSLPPLSSLTSGNASLHVPLQPLPHPLPTAPPPPLRPCPLRKPQQTFGGGPRQPVPAEPHLEKHPAELCILRGPSTHQGSSGSSSRRRSSSSDDGGGRVRPQQQPPQQQAHLLCCHAPRSLLMVQPSTLGPTAVTRSSRHVRPDTPLHLPATQQHCHQPTTQQYRPPPHVFQWQYWQ